MDLNSLYNRIDFDQIYNKYNKLVSEWVVADVDALEADDVIQEIWEKVWRSLPDFRGEAKLETWLYRITKNHLINHRTRQKSVEAVSLNVGWEDDDEQEEDANLSHSDTPDLEAEKTETPLTEEENRMVELFGLGVPISQIASMYNKTEKAVNTAISRVKKKWTSGLDN